MHGSFARRTGCILFMYMPAEQRTEDKDGDGAQSGEKRERGVSQGLLEDDVVRGVFSYAREEVGDGDVSASSDRLEEAVRRQVSGMTEAVGDRGSVDAVIEVYKENLKTLYAAFQEFFEACQVKNPEQMLPPRSIVDLGALTRERREPKDAGDPPEPVPRQGDRQAESATDPDAAEEAGEREHRGEGEEGEEDPDDFLHKVQTAYNLSQDREAKEGLAGCLEKLYRAARLGGGEIMRRAMEEVRGEYRMYGSDQEEEVRGGQQIYGDDREEVPVSPVSEKEPADEQNSDAAATEGETDEAEPMLKKYQDEPDIENEMEQESSGEREEKGKQEKRHREHSERIADSEDIIDSATSINDLCEKIRANSVSLEGASPDEVAAIVRFAAHGSEDISTVTRAAGLRDKVKALIADERAAEEEKEKKWKERKTAFERVSEERTLIANATSIDDLCEKIRANNISLEGKSPDDVAADVLLVARGDRDVNAVTHIAGLRKKVAELVAADREGGVSPDVEAAIAGATSIDDLCEKIESGDISLEGASSDMLIQSIRAIKRYNLEVVDGVIPAAGGLGKKVAELVAADREGGVSPDVEDAIANATSIDDLCEKIESGDISLKGMSSDMLIQSIRAIKRYNLEVVDGVIPAAGGLGKKVAELVAADRDQASREKRQEQKRESDIKSVVIGATSIDDLCEKIKANDISLEGSSPDTLIQSIRAVADPGSGSPIETVPTAFGLQDIVYRLLIERADQEKREKVRKPLQDKAMTDGTIIQFRKKNGDNPVDLERISFREFRPWFGDGWADRIADMVSSWSDTDVMVAADDDGMVERVTVDFDEKRIGDGKTLTQPNGETIDRFIRKSSAGGKEDIIDFEGDVPADVNLRSAVESVLKISALSYAGNATLMEQAIPKLAENLIEESKGDIESIIDRLRRVSGLRIDGDELHLRAFRKGEKRRGMWARRSVIARADITGMGLS